MTGNFSKCDVGKDGKILEFKDIDADIDENGRFDVEYGTTVAANK